MNNWGDLKIGDLVRIDQTNQPRPVFGPNGECLAIEGGGDGFYVIQWVDDNALNIVPVDQQLARSIARGKGWNLP